MRSQKGRASLENNGFPVFAFDSDQNRGRLSPSRHDDAIFLRRVDGFLDALLELTHRNGLHRIFSVVE